MQYCRNSVVWVPELSVNKYDQENLFIKSGWSGYKKIEIKDWIFGHD